MSAVLDEGYIVELELGCWIAPWVGDPGRTVVMDNAKVYPTKLSAKHALAQARRLRPFENARIIRRDLKETP